MSGDSNFIARWSRLKQQAAEEKRSPPVAGPTADDRRSADAEIGQEAGAKTEAPRGHAAAKAVESEPPFDPASLPPIESIVAGTDIRAFLQKGVPAALTKAALRRAWTTDPAIRDFIEVAENQWDFTDPTAIPGFGPLQASDNLRQLVEQGLGNLPETTDAPEAAGAPRARFEPIADTKDTADAPPDAAPIAESPMHMQSVAVQKGSDNLDTPSVAALQHPEAAPDAGNAPRRKGHGRALPK